MLWKDKKISVIGDVMLDHYLSGDATRISPEAPVPVVNKRSDKYVPGGAANAAANVALLGGDAYLLGVSGNDMRRDILLQELDKLKINNSGVLADPKRITTCKTRVMGNGHQITRIDDELTDLISADLENFVMLSLEKLPLPEVIVVSDYAKGVITPGLMRRVAEFGLKNSIKVIVDPKPYHGVSYANGYLVTPNKKEAEIMAGMSIRSMEDLKTAGKFLVGKLDSNVLITLGEEGMMLFEIGKEPYHIPTIAKEVSDVSGAGDTVIATIAVGIAGKMPLREAVELANKAAGIKVSKVGTSPVSYEELFGLGAA